MTEIYDAILEELKHREVYKYDVFGPFYVCSFACHFFNLHNRKHEVYYEAREIPSLRMHILFVAPAGWSKSFYMKQFLQGKYAIFRKTGLNYGFESTITEAGFVGTIRYEAGEIVVIDGAAKIYADGILGIDEFSAIIKALQQQHSTQLDTQLLAALDHGLVCKRLGMGKIEYETQLTLWAGVQPARFDLTSGMGRRFIYLAFFPTRKESYELMDAWWRSKNIRPNLQELEQLRAKIRRFIKDIECVRQVDFSDDILREYQRLGLFPFEGTYFDRLLIGYHLAAYGPEEKMVISLRDNELRRLINLELKWRRQIMMDVEATQLTTIIESFGGAIDRQTLMEECIMLGLDVRKVGAILENMRRNGLITIKGDTIVLRSSKPSVPRSPDHQLLRPEGSTEG